MNRRTALLLLLTALGAISWWLASTRGPTTLDRPLSDFMVADTAAVDRIFIAETNGRTADLRRVPGGWTVSRDGRTYKARGFEVRVLLKTFLRVEVKSPVPKSGEAVILRNMAAAGKKVEIYQGGKKPVKTWIVGHGTKDKFGTYMLLEKAEGRSRSPFIVGMGGFTGILSSRFHADIDIWRDPEVFRFDDLRDIAALEVERPGVPSASYRIGQSEGGEMRLTGPDGRELPFDTVLVKGALLPFMLLNYEYIDRNPTREQRDSILASTPNHVLRVTARDGTTRQVKFWYKPYEGEETAPDAAQQLHDKVRMHALVQDTLLVTVQRQTFDRVLLPPVAFLP